jgi:hypothetical protein
MRDKNVSFTATSEAVSTSTSEILALNSKRSYLLVQNMGAGVVYLNFGTTAVVGEGIKLNSGDAYEPFQVPHNALHAIGDAAATITILEA